MHNLLTEELRAVQGGGGSPASEGWEAGLEFGNMIGKKIGEFISIWKYINE